MNNSYVKIKISGKNPLLFFKINILGKIEYKNLKYLSHKEIILDIDYHSYLILKNIKSSYEIKVIKFSGLNMIENIIKNNLSLTISAILSILFLFFISKLCFSIDIIHSDRKVRNLIKEELTKNNIKKLTLIPSFDKRKKIIEKIIKNNKNDIEWLEIERKGSKLIVKVTQRKINKEKENLSNRHIIAKKSGIIRKIESSSGVILKKKNDYVNKGDIIISGDIIKDETVKGQVVSQGIVYAEVWYKVSVSYPLYYEETLYLDEVKQNIIVTFFDKNYQLRKNYVDSYLEKNNVLIKEKIVPFQISLCKQRKTKKNIQKLTKEEALKKAISLAQNKLSVKLNDDEYIISKKNLNYSMDESTIIVDVFFKVYENITDYKNTDEIIQNEES